MRDEDDRLTGHPLWPSPRFPAALEPWSLAPRGNSQLGARALSSYGPRLRGRQTYLRMWNGPGGLRISHVSLAPYQRPSEKAAPISKSQHERLTARTGNAELDDRQVSRLHRHTFNPRRISDNSPLHLREMVA